jgi:hypothetical protein
VTRSTGNARLKAARVAAGYTSQKALAEAITVQASHLGIRGLVVSDRQVRRWESDNPPWPHADAQRALTHLLGQGLEDLGFTPPWGAADPGRRALVAGAVAVVSLGAVPTVTAGSQPASVGGDYLAITQAHRRLYWSVAPDQLLATVLEHARLGHSLLPQLGGAPRVVLASALAESYLLAGRIQFFDQQQPTAASGTWVRALQAAGEADDALLGSAILAHSAFIPGWGSDREAAVERMRAARAYARRVPAPPVFLAWLDAVEAECETRCGHTRTALHLIGHAEDVLSGVPDGAPPAWMDWFSPARLAAFKGNTQLRAGHIPQARTTLLSVLDELPPESEKQRSVVLGDLAAVEVAAGNAEEACGFAFRALDQLATHWYATGMDRVREVRRNLAAWQHEPCVRALDDRLYDWGTTVSALQR